MRESVQIGKGDIGRPHSRMRYVAKKDRKWEILGSLIFDTFLRMMDHFPLTCLGLPKDWRDTWEVSLSSQQVPVLLFHVVGVQDTSDVQGSFCRIFKAMSLRLSDGCVPGVETMDISADGSAQCGTRADE